MRDSPLPEEPLVSVILTTHNRVHFLAEAIASVLAQSYHNWELLVVDHGSTDGTSDYLAILPGRITPLYLPQSGRPSIAYNRGLAAARGQLVAFLHDDDRWRADKLAHQVAQFQANPVIAFVYSDTNLLFGDGRIISRALYPSQKHQGWLFEPLLGDCFIHPSVFMGWRPALDAVGWFDESLVTGEEYELWLRLAYRYPAGFSPETLATIRQHGNQFSRQSRIQLIYGNVITVLQRTGRSYPLTIRQRWQLNHHLARTHTHLGLTYLAETNKKEARHHFWQSLRLNPLQRRAWQAMYSSL